MSLYRTILLVDDDEEDQEIFLDALMEIDPQIQCSFANDGEQALKMLDGDGHVTPELVFIDLNMPKLNGKQVLQELKKIPHLKGIPVIMYSTFFGQHDIDEIAALGAAHHVVKATRFEELCNTLEEILAKPW